MDAENLTAFEALNLAVTLLGSQAALARICGVTQPAVFKWLDDRRQLPAKHVLVVEAATRVSRHDLRPDLYPRGLQDDVPFMPAADVAAGGEGGSDDRHPLLQGDGEADLDNPDRQRPAA